MKVVINDGGRKRSGFKGSAGDCVCRAFAIASGVAYQDVYDLINNIAKSERLGKRKRGKSTARDGVYKSTTYKLAKALGGVWTPTMGIGTGCKVHVRESELPAQGRFVLALSMHCAAWIDGALHDIYDSSRNGTRCVYGYWEF